MSASTVAKCIGSSSDGRTNRWRVTCPACGHEFVPLTTRLATQYLQCPKPKCNASMVADYNAEPASVKLIADAAEKGQNNG